MSVHSLLVAVVSSLVFGTTVAPAQPLLPGGPPAVTAIVLTDGSGSRTAAATAGLEDLGQEAGAETTGLAPATVALGAGSRARLAAHVPLAPPSRTVAILTRPMATSEFVVAGVSWDGEDGLPENVQIYIRVREGRGWSEWAGLEDESQISGPDGEVVTGGTESFVTGGARAVQLQMTADVEALPADMRLTLVPRNPGGGVDATSDPLPRPDLLPSHDPLADRGVRADARAATFAPGAGSPLVAADPSTAAPSAFALAISSRPAPTVIQTSTTVSQPTVIDRAGWGADESLPVESGVGTWTVRYAPIQASVIHHTAGTNSYAPEDSAGIVRAIYYFHTVTRGWGDIGYNFLVDRFGRVFEGRKGTLAAAPGEIVTAGHARGYNTGTIGISVMGNFENLEPPQVSLDSISSVLAWQFARGAIDLTKSSGLTSPGTAARPAGQRLPRVFGHKDVADTACPGRIYGELRSIARDTRRLMPALLLLTQDLRSPAEVTFYFGDLDAESLVGDWDGDGTDTPGTRDGALFRLRNANSFGPADIVTTYGRSTDEVIVGDWDGDGEDTLGVRRGSTYYLKNTLVPGPATIVTTYGRSTDDVIVGDWDGDGQDTLGVRRGSTYYLKNTLVPGPATIVFSYGRSSDLALVGDWDGDRDDTIGVRRLS